MLVVSSLELAHVDVTALRVAPAFDDQFKICALDEIDSIPPIPVRRHKPTRQVRPDFALACAVVAPGCPFPKTSASSAMMPSIIGIATADSPARIGEVKLPLSLRDTGGKSRSR